MTVRLSALRAGRPLAPARFLVLISVRGWVNPRAIVRLEGLDQLKSLVTSSRNMVHMCWKYGFGSVYYFQSSEWLYMNHTKVYMNPLTLVYCLKGTSDRLAYFFIYLWFDDAFISRIILPTDSNWRVITRFLVLHPLCGAYKYKWRVYHQRNKCFSLLVLNIFRPRLVIIRWVLRK
jgi:hypothetical protein